MKILFKLFAAICALIVVASITVVIMIDPNDYKPQIQDRVKQSINRELQLEGDISWSLFPSLGFVTSDVYIQNPEGFNRDNLLEIKQASVAVDLMPLFSGELNIGKVRLDGFRLNVITGIDGVSNLDGLSDPDNTGSPDGDSPTEDPGSQDHAPALEKFNLGGIEITNAMIEIQDLAAGSEIRATIKHLRLGQFALGQDTELSMLIELVLAEDLKGEIELNSTLRVARDMALIELNELQLNTRFTGQSLPGGAVSSSLSSDLSFNLRSGVAKVNNIMFNTGEMTLAGWLRVEAKKAMAVRFKLAGNRWDLSPYMSNNSSEQSQPEPGSDQAGAEPDLSGLNKLDVNGQLSLEGLKVAGLTLGKITSKIIIADGQARLAPLKANLYDGQIEVTAMVDDADGRNSYRVDQKLSGIQIQPLLQDLADLGIISGTTELNLTAKGQGLSLDKIKSQLIASGDFKISDGSLYGINIPQQIRSAKASLSGKSIAENSAQQTDFTSLVGKFKLTDGVFDSSALTMDSPLLRLNGSGRANIISETVDYKLAVTVVGSLEGQGSGDEQLSGLTIPLRVSGTFADPKFGLDTGGALKAQLDAEKQKLKDRAKQLLKDQLKDKLGNWFGN